MSNEQPSSDTPPTSVEECVASLLERRQPAEVVGLTGSSPAYLLARSDAGGAVRGTHQEIAVELGTVREVVSRHLKRLETAGLVGLGRSGLRVTDREGLRRLAVGGLKPTH